MTGDAHPEVARAGDDNTRLQRVIFWGTYDLGKPRTRILKDGLQANGVDVLQIHADIWAKHDDKSRMSKGAVLQVLLRALLSYPGLIWRYLRAPSHDAVIVPYLGQFDVIVLWPFARLRRASVVWDMFISLYDTVVCDRKMEREGGLLARCLKALEWTACRAASRVILDTPAHASRIASLFGLPQERVGYVPVGAEPGAFARITPREKYEGPLRVLFYGQLSPLHGIETILDAALSERGRAHQWHIIGTGQDSDRLSARLEAGDAPHVTWERWRNYEELVEAIAQADVCLGVFGPSEKANSVVPNKVFQCLMAGRTVITRQAVALDELFPAPRDGILTVPPQNADALLDALDKARAEGFPTMPQERLNLARPEEIAKELEKIIADQRGRTVHA